MKDKTSYPVFLTISPSTCQIKIFVLAFFSRFKKFDPALLVNKKTFPLQTMAVQAKLSSHYVFQSHTLWF